MLPEAFKPGAGESLETWRDRLFQQFRVPFVHGALSDLKLPYVEIISPLLSDSLVFSVRQLPDPLRTGKLLLKRITIAMSPDIPFATAVAIQPLGAILQSPRVVELLRDNLAGNSAGRVLPRELADYIVARVTTQRPAKRRTVVGRRIRIAAKGWAPSWIKQLRPHSTASLSMDGHRLAFRAFVVSQASRMFAEDATAPR